MATSDCGRTGRVLATLTAHLAPTSGDTAAQAQQKPRLLYFQGTGKCYGVRMAMFAAFGKHGWIDERIAQTGEPGSHPDGVSRGPGAWRDLSVNRIALPELTLPDGSTVCQSMAIARWAARWATEHGRAALYPSDATEALRVDEIMTFQEEVRSLATWLKSRGVMCLHLILSNSALPNAGTIPQVMEKAQPTPPPEDVQGFREAFHSHTGFFGRTAGLLERYDQP